MEIRDSIVYIISNYKYPGLYVLFIVDTMGVFLPTKTILTFTGILVQKGLLSFPPLFLSAITGSLTGYCISYTIGLKLGKPFLYNYCKYFFLTRSKIEKAEKWFIRYGPAFIMIAYFIPGARHVTPYLSGISGMSFSRTFTFASIGAAIWITTFVSLGRFFGQNLHFVEDLLTRYGWKAAAVILTVVSVLVFIIIILKRRKRI